MVFVTFPQIFVTISEFSHSAPLKAAAVTGCGPGKASAVELSSHKHNVLQN